MVMWYIMQVILGLIKREKLNSRVSAVAKRKKIAKVGRVFFSL